jgi:hypothetical protein
LSEGAARAAGYRRRYRELLREGLSRVAGMKDEIESAIRALLPTLA